MISRKTKYGLIAVLHLARHYGRGARLIGEIAEAENLPRKFLEAILLELRNAGFLDSKKGRGGGYVLARPPEELRIGDMIRVLDGPLAPLRCASVTAPVLCEDCPDPHHCSVRALMMDTRDAISSVLDNTTLAQLLERSGRLDNDQKALAFEI
jgi:Rrf2 family protein